MGLGQTCRVPTRVAFLHPMRISRRLVLGWGRAVLHAKLPAGGWKGFVLKKRLRNVQALRNERLTDHDAREELRKGRSAAAVVERRPRRRPGRMVPQGPRAGAAVEVRAL